MTRKSEVLKYERPLEKRKRHRFTAQFRSTFSGGQREGEGKTIDLSEGGCKIETSQPVVVGAMLECRIHAPGLNWPLRVDEAQVRWTKGNVFGVHFVSIQPEEQMKLRRILANLRTEQNQ